MIKAAIFDIDGTLIDSVDQHAEAWRLAFHEFGRFIPAGTIRTQIGKGGDQLLPVFLSRDEQLSFGEALEKLRSDIWKNQFLMEVKPFPRVRDLFEALLQRSVRIALASSGKEDEVEYYKKLLNVSDLISADTSADDAERTKPHPDIFEAALTQAKIQASEAIVIGDTPYDAEAAERASMKSVGVLCGGFPKESLSKCARIYRDPADLLGNLDGWIHLNNGTGYGS